MIKAEYKTKDMKPSQTKRKDGEIYQDGNLWKFMWKGGECGYLSKEDAEKGLKKVSEG
jgi:hypothetical protein|tara:strand:+ start:245 stop:418 length:174 start_codon:yes stop_codon:yes gene_type:complete